MEQLLQSVKERAIAYLVGLDSRSVAPSLNALRDISQFDEPFPVQSTDAEAVLALLDQIGSTATVATAGSRYFGFVVGGSLPVALGANWLAGVWDQHAALNALSPVAAKLEAVAMRWLLDVLRLPAECGVGFVNCATQANFSGLAAARLRLACTPRLGCRSTGAIRCATYSQ